MLELTELQLQNLRLHEHIGFIARVRAELVAQFVELLDDDRLDERLCKAHDRALALGLESGRARTQFLYQEAFSPKFYEQPAVDAWLRRPGADPEQRWQDFAALAQARFATSDEGV